MEMYLPEVLDNNARIQPHAVMYEKIETAVSKGAAAIIFVNTASWRSDPSTRLGQTLEPAGVPVVFATKKIFEYWKQNPDANIRLATEVLSQTYTALNVAGYINNNAEYTVIIGGHYDHLGFGGRSSRSPQSKLIHPGADDNASGIAGMLETALYLKNSTHNSYNYLFIAFSAEEKGLLGSRYFTISEAYDMDRINYMLNFDMIGRLENNKLTMIGTGSSPVWDTIIDSYPGNHPEIRKNPGGVGGSDHTSFYLKNIPVLFFFTGLHDDYHRPEDTPDKINYDGMADVISFSYYIIKEAEKRGKIEFYK
jgi:aminopeptidase YwaD